MKRTRPYPHFKFPDEIDIVLEILTEDKMTWFGANKPSYTARTANYGWFPTEILMGVTGKIFDHKHEKSIHNGASIGISLGTASILVTMEKANNAMQTLRDAGYNVRIKSK